MSIKSIIFAAAAAVAVTSTAASADSYFHFGLNLQASDVLELGNVTIDRDGVVEIYDYRLGTQGALLGSEPLHAGANTDVKIDTGFSTESDVLAVLKIDGQVVATKKYDINS